jgi:hypothetical protein
VADFEKYTTQTRKRFERIFDGEGE